MPERVLVTGASGFVAKHCIAELIKNGYDVRGTVRRKAAEPEVIAAVSQVVDPQGRLEFAHLDLTSDDGWDAAMRGCRYLMHVASPNPIRAPRNADDVVRPAVDGTRRALAAGARNRIERAVLTSSLFAMSAGHRPRLDHVFSENDWADVHGDSIAPYPMSKALAERAAMDFMANDKSGMTLTVINPGIVFGPALDRDLASSIEFIALMLSGAYPAVPRIHIAVVDVRDVAAMHVAALKAPQAAGQRFICADEALWFAEIGQVLKDNYPGLRRRIPTRELPDFVVRLLAVFDAPLRSIVPDLSKLRPASNEKACTTFGFRFRPAKEAIMATAQSLIDLGVVRMPSARAA